jgi:hypothetical protein
MSDAQQGTPDASDQRRSTARGVPQAVDACHGLLVWLVPQLDKFPRTRRFTLGARLEEAVLEVLEALIEAAYSRSKREPLRRANLRLAVGRHLWRAAYELQVVPHRQYQYGARLIDDLGRQIGAWLRARSEQ